MVSEKANIRAAWHRERLIVLSLAHVGQEQLKTWNPTSKGFQGGATPTSKCQASHTESRRGSFS